MTISPSSSSTFEGDEANAVSCSADREVKVPWLGVASKFTWVSTGLPKPCDSSISDALIASESFSPVSTIRINRTNIRSPSFVSSLTFAMRADLPSAAKALFALAGDMTAKERGTRLDIGVAHERDRWDAIRAQTILGMGFRCNQNTKFLTGLSFHFTL